MQLKAATYVRVSRADQNSQLQSDETAELVQRRGWILHEQFGDEGISGSHDRRPSLQAMLVAARKKRFNVLVVYRCDRLFRSLRDLILDNRRADLARHWVRFRERVDRYNESAGTPYAPHDLSVR